MPLVISNSSPIINLAIKSEIDKLQEKANFWLKDTLIEGALVKVGEL